MKKILTTITILLTLFSMFSFADSPSPDKTYDECHIDSNRISEIRKQTNDCVTEELSKDTKQGNLLRRLTTPDDFSETQKTIMFFVGLAAIALIVKVVHSLVKATSNESFKEMTQNKSKTVFTSIIVIFIVSIITSESSLKSSHRLINDSLWSMPLNMYTSLVYIKEKINPVLNTTISASKSQIQDKVLSFNSAIVDTQLCAISYKQELISYHNTKKLKNEFDKLNSVDEIVCIDEFVTDNSSKSYQDLGNTTLLSSAIRHCSQKFGVFYQDCGGYKLEADLQPLNKAFEASIEQTVAFTNEYVGMTCKASLEADKEGNEAFCLEYKNGSVKPLDSDLTMEDIYPLFNKINIEAAEKVSSALIGTESQQGLKLKDIESNTKLLSIIDLTTRFFSSGDRSKQYQTLITNELSKISITESKTKMLDNGYNVKEKSLDDMVILDAEDYFFKINGEIRILFDSSSLSRSAINDSFNFLSDYKLAFGNYTDAKGEKNYKVNFNSLSQHKNYTELMTVLASIKVYAKLMLNSNSSIVFEMLNVFSNIAMLVLNFEKIFVYIVAGLFVGAIVIAVIDIIVRFLIESLSVYFIGKPIEIVANTIIQFIMLVSAKTYVPILALLRNVLMISTIIQVCSYTVLATSNAAGMLLLVVVIKIINVVYLTSSVFWVGNYLSKTLKTTDHGLSGSMFVKYLRKYGRV